MRKKINVCIFIMGFLYLLKPMAGLSQSSVKVTIIKEKLEYHQIHLNKADLTILPWYSSDLGNSFDFVIGKVWNFWNTMRIDKNGLPYYMNHQVWVENFNDRRGIGGDQFAMALSSWNLYYGYSGIEDVKENMKFIADYYLTHSTSPSNVAWPDIPYSYNNLIYSGLYDGDMVLGKDFIQPDKAGSFGFELVKLYKMTSTFTNATDKLYLDAAIKIANTLSQHIIDGDENNSPLPFKVNAITGETGKLIMGSQNADSYKLSSYTTNWSGTMELFLSLINLKASEVENYQNAFNKLLHWMKSYPLKTNKWGPFFEDVPGWSNTQINAITFTQFMMNHQEYFPDWRNEVKEIFSWVYKNFGNKKWEKYGVIVVNEQTNYQVPGNSHSSRQASAELQYASLTNDRSSVKNAIRQLSWATYMVDNDGKNVYPKDNEIWMTDGYGDYVRHYLRAMAFWPELAPADQNHLLSSTSVIQLMEYQPHINKSLALGRPIIPSDKVKNTLINYRTYDNQSKEIIRMTKKPVAVLVNQKNIPETDISEPEGWNWKSLEKGGLLTIRHLNGNRVAIMGN